MYPNRTLLVTAMVASLSMSASAQDEIDNIVTTASRTPLEKSRVGSSISLIERAHVEQRQSLIISDVLQDLPGVAVSRAGGPGAQTQLRIRGAEANHLLVLVDGIEMNEAAIGDEFGFDQLTSWDIERIELVRGPQSALWGSDAVAGAVNIITRQGQDPLRGNFAVEGGSYGTKNLAGRFGGNLGELSSDLMVSRYDSNGDNVARTGSEDDGYENTSITWNNNLRASDILSFGLMARHSDGSTEFDDTFLTGLPTDADRVSEIELAAIHGTADLDLLDQRWRHRLQLGYSDSERQNLADGSLTDEQAGERTSIAYQTSYAFPSTTGDYQLVLALDHEKEEFSQRFLGFAGADQSQDRDSTGYVVELIAQPWQQLSTSLSLRHDNNSDFKDKTSFRATGSYLVDASNTRLHASYGTGMKKPTFIELFGFISGSFTGNPDLKPEESKGWDFGIEQSIYDGRLIADITCFSATLEDEIQGLFTTVINAEGRSRRRGVETSLTAKFTDRLTGLFSYTHTNAQEKNPAGEQRREIRRPRHMASANLNYAMLQERVNLNLNVSYTGEQDDLDFSSFPANTVTLDDYTLVNLTASYAFSDSLILYARAENLFDEDYENVLGFQTPSDAYYIGLRMKLGE